MCMNQVKKLVQGFYYLNLRFPFFFDQQYIYTKDVSLFPYNKQHLHFIKNPLEGAYIMSWSIWKRYIFPGLQL